MRKVPINELKELLERRTTSDNPKELRAALKQLADKIKRHGLTVEIFEKNNKPSLLAYRGNSRPKKFAIILNGHLDVVPAKDEQFAPTVKNDKLYGRGALDMKTAALVMTEVFCSLATTLDYPLGLQIVTDEEVGGHNGTLYQIEQGVRSDFVVAGEFTPRNAICTESKGICWLDISFTGVAAHSAYLWNGENALLHAHRFIDGLLSLYPMPSKEDWVTSVNIAQIATSNITFNRVPDDATVSVDIRFVPGDKNFKSPDTVKALIAKLDATAKPSIKNLEPSHQANNNNTTLKLLEQNMRQMTGKPVRLIRKHGASDVRHYSAHHAQAIVLGLQGEGLHGDEEYVILRSIDEYYAILMNFLKARDNLDFRLIESVQ